MIARAVIRLKFPLEKFRYRLSTILIALTAISIFLGVIARQRNWVVQSERALQKLEIDGAKYSDNYVPSYALGIYVGDRADLYNLWWENRHVTDQDFACLAWFTELEVVHVSGINITSQSLSHLSRNRRLRFLDLSQNKISGAGFGAMQHFHELEELILDDTDVTDRELQYLAKLPKLRRLSLVNTKITDEGLKQIGCLSSLEYLELSGTKVTEAGLGCLIRLPKLDELYLNLTQISENNKLRFWEDHSKATTRAPEKSTP